MATLFWFNGTWHTENPRVVGIGDHVVWQGSGVFDGARAIAGTAPDLDRHCQRAINSARYMGMEPPIDAQRIEALAREGIKKFPADAVLYIKPVFWIGEGLVVFDPKETQFALHIWEIGFPKATFTAMKSSLKRPSSDMAPTEAKAACLYPQTARALREAQAAGFDNAVMEDPFGNVAEFATSNLFIAKDGVVRTPKPNGTFLNGITRQRVIALLRESGVSVEEVSLPYAEVEGADEIFSTGNIAKVQSITRLGSRDLQPGPIGTRARELYFEWAKTQKA